jgi:NAD(P)-dependent dehydrogenase (short-subunit alcohol dehydrogenase family)
MRRGRFSPYGPSKAALESETLIWAQELDGTGVSVNAVLPGGATLTGIIPGSIPEAHRGRLAQSGHDHPGGCVARKRGLRGRDGQTLRCIQMALGSAGGRSGHALRQGRRRL